MKLLIIGQSIELTIPVPEIFSGAGFEIICISTKKILRSHPFITKFYLAKNTDLLLQTSLKILNTNTIDMVIISDDETIINIIDSDLKLTDKEKLLPVISADYFGHLGSKIGLSIALSKFGVRTPKFSIVNDKSELLDATKIVGFPLMLKGDRSGGGSQTIEIQNKEELHNFIDIFNYYPALMQEKINGNLIAIEGFYAKGDLVHFSYSSVLETISNKKFTPSVVRCYSQLGILDKEIFDELGSLGKALGINGLVNITCMHSYEDKYHYFIEADVRPTIWVGYSKYFGDFVDTALKAYLIAAMPLSYPIKIDNNFPSKITIPYFLRLSFLDLIMNKYLVRKFIPINLLIIKLLLKKHLIRQIEGLLTLRFIRRKLRNN